MRRNSWRMRNMPGYDPSRSRLSRQNQNIFSSTARVRLDERMGLHGQLLCLPYCRLFVPSHCLPSHTQAAIFGVMSPPWKVPASLMQFALNEFALNEFALNEFALNQFRVPIGDWLVVAAVLYAPHELDNRPSCS